MSSEPFIIVTSVADSLEMMEKKSSKENKMVKRKILPSSDLLGDCEIDPTLKIVQTDSATSREAEVVTPDSPTTPDFTDNDDVFDNDFEMSGMI